MISIYYSKKEPLCVIYILTQRGSYFIVSKESNLLLITLSTWYHTENGPLPVVARELVSKIDLNMNFDE